MVERLCAGATPDDVDVLESWVYDYELARSALVRMIVLHELPFFVVDYDRFRDFVYHLNPIFKMISRTTIKLDCMKAFEKAKLELKEIFENLNTKVSLTADMWTSNQTLGYLCVTCHWIIDWKIQKSIIKFFMIESPHNAQAMFNVILKCIQEWNIEDKIFNITLDNAQVNNSMLGLLRNNLLLKKMLPCEGKLFHVRCGAHIINLVVQDGLKHFSGIMDNIRGSVKYIRSSQSRREKFEEVVGQVGISSEKMPSLDTSTRWNSTYLMLESAFPFRTAFDELSKQDKNYSYAPSFDEWEMSRVVCSFLKVFHDATVVLSGSSYPTANRYFHELWKIKLAMDEESSNNDQTIVAMVKEMQQKFNHYWEISYLSMSIPVILDPRFKYAFVEFRLSQFFGTATATKIDRIRRTLQKLFSEYSSQTNHSNTRLAYETNISEVNTEEDDSFADWDQHQSAKLRTQASSELDK